MYNTVKEPLDIGEGLPIAKDQDHTNITHAQEAIIMVEQLTYTIKQLNKLITKMITNKINNHKLKSKAQILQVYKSQTNSIHYGDLFNHLTSVPQTCIDRASVVCKPV